MSVIAKSSVTCVSELKSVDGIKFTYEIVLAPAVPKWDLWKLGPAEPFKESPHYKGLKVVNVESVRKDSTNVDVFRFTCVKMPE